MKKYMVDKEEWYPVVSIVPSDSSWASEGEVEFSKDEVARIEAAFKEFDAVQDLIFARTKGE